MTSNYAPEDESMLNMPQETYQMRWYASLLLNVQTHRQNLPWLAGGTADRRHDGHREDWHEEEA